MFKNITLIALIFLLLNGCVEEGEPLIDKYSSQSVPTEESITDTFIDLTTDTIEGLLGNSIELEGTIDAIENPSQTIIKLLEQYYSDEQVTTDTIYYTVEYSRSRDGDTHEFIVTGVYQLVDDIIQEVDGDLQLNQKIVIRSLLINTPEISNNEAYSHEALEFADKQLSNAESIVVAHDLGEQQDHYSRELMYIWVDNTLLSELLLENGLAKVAYVQEPNTTYLDVLRAAEKRAKDIRLGVWSLQ